MPEASKMLRSCLLILSSSLLVAPTFGQDPAPATPPKPPVTVGPATGGPATGSPATGGPVGTEQEPKPKPEPAAKPEPKPAPEPGTGQQPEKPTDKPTEPGVPAPEVVETEVELPEVEELPAGADPDDLRAMRGARDMLEAERQMRALIKAGKIKDIDLLLSFEEISSWPYEDGLKNMPKAVKELDSKRVVMTGFMLPIDEVEDIKEFLLVQSLWACCYGQPPDINGIVRVVMRGDKRTDYQFDPIQVRGSFEIEATYEQGYCIDIYQLHADHVSLIK